MSERDPYRLLGITRDATTEDVRAAFRKLVRQRHPDTASPEEEDRDVQSVVDAYHLLIDPERRARYDEASQATTSPAGTRVDVTQPSRPESSRWRGRRLVRCRECGGRGLRVSIQVCRSCEGQGEITAFDVRRTRVVRCRTCLGYGQARSTELCESCAGRGVS